MLADCVIDTCIAVKWVVPEPDAAAALELRRAPLHAPSLLHYEFANALRGRERLRQVPAGTSVAALSLLRRTSVALTPTEVLLDDALSIGLAIEHPLGDCVFLALARREGIPLVTVDRALLRRGRSIAGVTVISLAEAVA
jgi:predicted nucleic acid-binding protein